MKAEQLVVINFSDVHLGHSNTPTIEVLKNLSIAFSDSSGLENCDIIFFTGDFFDKLLHLPDPNVMEIRMWINGFLKLCKKYDIVLRILEGTPSHDWKQSKLFTHINKMVNIEADVEYIETLSIERNEKLGINILYVPDEWNPECDDTWKDVQQLLRKENLNKVDFCVMHGAFSHQLPGHINVPTHDPIRYQAITNYYIFIGHHHRHTVRGNIIAPGSFDRICHGEEERKGYVKATIKKNGKSEIVLVENKTAKIYKTIKCKDIEVKDTLKYIASELENLPHHSFIRIEAAKTNPILVSMDVLRDTYLFFRFSTKIDKDIEVSTQTLIDLRNSYQPISITKSNIEKLILDRLTNLDESVIARLKELLSEYA